MILGVGTDIAAIERIARLEGNWDDPFFLRAFTPRERHDALASDDPITAFAVRFSMKEAVFKALRMSPDDARFGQIEYVTDELGRPSVTLSGSMDAVAREQGPYRLHVSASYENDYASTLAVLETGESPLASTE
jgi:phosphopantetheine--protein transferase-like protein